MATATKQSSNSKEGKGKTKIAIRKKVPPTYLESHNKAVKSYKRNASVFIFIGILNVIGAVFFLIPLSTDNDYMAQFLCLSLEMFFVTLDPIPGAMLEAPLWSSIIFMVISAGIAAVIIWLGAEARLGKKKYLYTSIILAIVDWVFLILCYSIRGEYSDYFMSYNDLWLALGMHVIYAYFIIRCYFYYRRVYMIEYLRDHPQEGKVSRKWIRAQMKADKIKENELREEKKEESVKASGK